MTTHIRIKKDTYDKLSEIKNILSTKKGRWQSFDDTIKYLIEKYERYRYD